MKQNRNLSEHTLGILCILCAAFCFACMSLFVRLSGNLPSVQKSFFRNLIALIIAGTTLARSGVKFTGKKEGWLFLVLRASFGTVGILANFYAIDHMVIADANILNKLAPFFAILFSFFLLKEKIEPAQAVLVLGAFIGALFIIKPTTEGLEAFPAFIGLLGGMGAGAAYTCVRKLSIVGEKGPCIVAFFSGFSCLVTLPFLLLDYHPMTLNQLFLLIIAGSCAAGGQFAVTAAYSHAPAKELSVYDYSQILFSALIGFLAFGELPDLYSWIGYVIIIGMAVLMFLYNKRKN